MAEVEISTMFGTFSLDAAAYGAGMKLGAAANSVEMDGVTRDTVYRYFIDRPEELVSLVNLGWLKPDEIKRVK